MTKQINNNNNELQKREGGGQYLELLQMLSKMFRFQQSIMSHSKKEKSLAHTQGKGKQKKLPVKVFKCQIYQAKTLKQQL